MKTSFIHRLFLLLVCVFIHNNSFAEGDYSAGLSAYIAKDYSAAQSYWLKAAEQADARSMFNLGLLHAQKKLEDADQSLADSWINKAGEAGYAAADYYFAKRLKARGARQEEIFIYLQRAASNGSYLAKQAMQELPVGPVQIVGESKADPATLREPKVPDLLESTAPEVTQVEISNDSEITPSKTVEPEVVDSELIALSTDKLETVEVDTALPTLTTDIPDPEPPVVEADQPEVATEQLEAQIATPITVKQVMASLEEASSDGLGTLPEQSESLTGGTESIAGNPEDLSASVATPTASAIVADSDLVATATEAMDSEVVKPVSPEIFDDSSALLSSNQDQRQAEIVEQAVVAPVTEAEVIAEANSVFRIESPETVNSDRSELKSTEQATETDVAVNAEVGPYLNEVWIQAQESSRWTIQLSVFREFTDLEAFLKQYQLEKTAAYFRETTDRGVLYQLIYGSYEDKLMATNARDSLPLDLRKSRPWLRRMEGVQKIIALQ